MPLPDKPSDHPDNNELSMLPRWAAVALSARSARRVLPIFRVALPGCRREHEEALEAGIAMAESAAGLASADREAILACARRITSAVSEACDETRAPAEAAAASAVADAAQTAAGGAAKADGSVAEEASRVVERAIEALRNHRDRRIVSAAVRRDFEILQRAVKAHGLTDESPVPAEIFGPMWPNGRPIGWPE